MEIRTTRIAPGYYTATVDAHEIEIVRVRLERDFWIILVDGDGGDDYHWTKRDAIAATPNLIALIEAR
jgi:hypothetical protein